MNTDRALLLAGLQAQMLLCEQQIDTCTCTVQLQVPSFTFTGLCPPCQHAMAGIQRLPARMAHIKREMAASR